MSDEPLSAEELKEAKGWAGAWAVSINRNDPRTLAALYVAALEARLAEAEKENASLLRQCLAQGTWLQAAVSPHEQGGEG